MSNRNSKLFELSKFKHRLRKNEKLNEVEMINEQKEFLVNL